MTKSLLNLLKNNLMMKSLQNLLKKTLDYSNSLENNGKLVNIKIQKEKK